MKDEMMKAHPTAKVRWDGEGFFSQECRKCHEMKWQELFFSVSDGHGEWILKPTCNACELAETRR